MNEEIQALFQADQADRQADRPLPPDLTERDRARRETLEGLIAAGALQTTEDYFHAALIFQHGEHLNDYWRARELAIQAAERGSRPGRWLAAAAYDRWLMRQGKPQKYGTQYVASGGCWMLWELDSATTDEERAAWNVPALAEARRRAEEMTQQDPPPQDAMPPHAQDAD